MDPVSAHWAEMMDVAAVDVHDMTRSNPPPSPPPPLPLTNSRAFAPQVGTDWATLVNQHRADNALPMMTMPSSNSLFGNGRAADSPTLNSPRDQPGHSLNLHPRDMAQTLAYTNHDDRSGSEGRVLAGYGRCRSHEAHFYPPSDGEDEPPAPLAPGGIIDTLSNPNALTSYSMNDQHDEAEPDNADGDVHMAQPEDPVDGNYVDDGANVDDDVHMEQPEDTADGDYVDDGAHQEQPDNEDEDEEEEVQTAPAKYDFRHAARQARHVHSTVQDWDESGNYDPSEERKALRRGPAPKTPRTPKRPQEGFEESPSKKPRTVRQLSPSKARQLGASWDLVLPLKSEAGIEWMKTHPDNWPYGRDHNCFDDPLTGGPLDEYDGNESPTRRLRPRTRPIRYDSPMVEDESLGPLADPAGEHDDLRGHPAARGCIRCREVNEHCDLRKAGGVWPCVQCVTHFAGSKHIPCELITPPDRKQACEPCKDAEIDCSYAVEEGEEVLDDHSAPCRQCAASNQPCIAGPHAMPRRATYTPPPGMKYIKARAFVSCAPCRRARKHCSLRKKEDEPPCKSCSDSGTECTFEKVVASKLVDTLTPQADDNVVVAGPSALESNAPVAQMISDLQPAANRLTIADDSAVEADERPKNFIREKSTCLGSGPTADYYSQLFNNDSVAGPSDWKGKGRAKPHQIPEPEPEVIDLDDWKPKTSKKDQAKGRPSNVVAGPASYYEQFAGQETPNVQARTKPKSKYNQVKVINAPAPKMQKEPYVASDVPITQNSNEPKMEMEDFNGNKGFFDSLFTPYAHPIVFNGDQASRGCNWCKDTTYAMFGLGWVKPNVIAWTDGCGYTEVDDGHRAAGIPAGNMCFACVEKRFEILSCESSGTAERHKYQDFRSLWPLTMDRERRDDAHAVQMDRLYNGKPTADDKFCSICVGVASYECGHSRVKNGGCDLKFCDNCYTDFLSCRGGLQELLRHKLHTEKLMTEARADAGFLLDDSILVTSVFTRLSGQI